jgi:cyclohexanone monooxygenase
MEQTVAHQIRQLDAVVVGAGFGGIYMLHKLRNDLGLDAVAIDKAGGVGGTWYWNRYPGALSDSESFVYQYSFDRDLYHQTPWTTKYVRQPEILACLPHEVCHGADFLPLLVCCSPACSLAYQDANT